MLLEPNLIGKPIKSVIGSVYFDNQNNRDLCTNQRPSVDTNFKLN